MSLTVLVDYDSGNLHSAQKAFQRMAIETGAGSVLVSSRPEDVARADRIVLLIKGEVKADDTPAALMQMAQAADLTQAYITLTTATAP